MFVGLLERPHVQKEIKKKLVCVITINYLCDITKSLDFFFGFMLCEKMFKKAMK